MVKRYSGYRADTIDELTLDEDGVVMLEGEPYKIYNDYLVPYYPVGNEVAEIDREKLALDLARRFFRNAEIGINATFRYFEIKDLRSNYEMMEPGEEKRATGALIVGTMVNRMERLAHCIIQERAFEERHDLRNGLAAAIGDLEGVSLDDGAINEIAKHIETFNQHRLRENMYTRDLYREQKEAGDRIPSIEDQFKEYFKTLLTDKELVANVRRRERGKDRDGTLHEMLSEMGKPTQMPLNVVYDGRALKIGQAMEAIDQVRDQLLEIAEHMDTRIKRTLQEHIRTFADAARQRVGIKTDDAAAYAPAETRFKVTESTLFSFVRDELDKLRSKSTSTANPKRDALRLLHSGATIMDDMAEIRQPRAADDSELTRDNSSLVRFAEDAETILTRLAEKQIDH